MTLAYFKYFYLLYVYIYIYIYTHTHSLTHTHTHTYDIYVSYIVACKSGLRCFMAHETLFYYFTTPNLLHLVNRA
jgi:hypothetical protein